MKKVLKRISLFLKELVNILANVLVPVAALVAAILEILPVSMKWVKMVKDAEDFLYHLSGTGTKIRDQVEKQIEELEKKKKEIK